MEPTPAGMSTGIVEDEGREAEVGVGFELAGKGFDRGAVGQFQVLEIGEKRTFGRTNLRLRSGIFCYKKIGLTGGGRLSSSSSDFHAAKSVSPPMAGQWK